MGVINVHRQYDCSNHYDDGVQALPNFKMLKEAR